MSTWRNAILLEAAEKRSPAYYGIRPVGTSKRKYVEYAGGVRELYRLNTDRYELTNEYNPDASPAGLVSRLHALKSCSGATCRTAEDGAPPSP